MLLPSSAIYSEQTVRESRYLVALKESANTHVVCVHLCKGHDELFNIRLLNSLWMFAVICHNDSYIRIILPYALDEDPQLVVAQESLCCDSHQIVDVVT